MEDKKKVLPETATIANDSVSTNKAPVVSSNTHANASTVEVAITPADARAKVMKNLDYLINPLSAITLSVKKLLLTGEYKDLTRLAEHQEVNPPKHKQKTTKRRGLKF